MTTTISPGTLYGVGVGPGDPQWLTLQAVSRLGATRHIFAPRARIKQDSLALDIARPHLRPDAVIHEQTYPMSADPEVLRSSWDQAASEIQQVLESGEDACFITLGDCMLYSTFIYLRRALQKRAPHLPCQAIPGLPAFIAAASLTQTPLGEGSRPVTIVPAGAGPELEKALEGCGALVAMKVSDRLPALLEQLEAHQAKDRAVLVSHAGLPAQHIVPLAGLESSGELPSAYLSLVLVEAP